MDQRNVDVINDDFRGHYRFLSNFYESPFTLPDGNVARTVEHAFQAYKARHQDDYLAILAAATPGEAKRLGRRAAIHPDWDVTRVDVMRRLLALKFAEGTVLARRLTGTGDAFIVEGNTWHDRFWGVCHCAQCRGAGDNQLGRLLLARRDELRVLERAAREPEPDE